MSQRIAMLTTLLVWTQAGPIHAQTAGYPVIPRALPDSEEILLARSAAPAEISKAASVYTVRDGKPVLLRAGANGCSCMVSRDLHGGSLYPICFDVEATKSVLPRELMEFGMRNAGRSEDAVKRAVDSAYLAGVLRPPASLATAYMMSPRQMLFSSPEADGRGVGAWHPHIMLFMPNATPQQFGLAPDSKVDVISVGAPGTPRAEVVVIVPHWADGTPAPPR